MATKAAEAPPPAPAPAPAELAAAEAAAAAAAEAELTAARGSGWTISFADFEASPARLVDALDEWGVAHVRGVCSASECAGWARGLKGFFEGLGTGVTLSEELSELQELCPRSRWVVNVGGLCHNFGVAWLPEVWEVRAHHNVRRMFEAIWGQSELACSFDGVNVDRPKVETPRKPPVLGLHTDQSPHSSPADVRYCVQSALSLTPTVAASGGTTVMPGSHRHHRDLLLHQFPVAEKEYKKDWISLTDDMVAHLVARGCPVVHVETQPGDLVLWDSRTIHCGRKVRLAVSRSMGRGAVAVRGWQRCCFAFLCS